MSRFLICTLVFAMLVFSIGCTVTENKKAEDENPPENSSDADDDSSGDGGKMIEPMIVELEGFTAVGMMIEVDFEDTDPIGDLWGEFYTRMDEIGGYGSAMGIGFPIHVSFEYFACQAVKNTDDIPPGMIFREIPAATYASFPFEGEMEAMSDYLIRIKRDYLRAAGVVADPNNNIILEMYPPTPFDEITGELTAEIFIPIKPKDE